MGATAKKGDVFDTVVVGGGIAGLAVARELLKRRTGSSVVVVEKAGDVATHQTGHNSGVIHSGVYYKPGSLKARLCVDGARSMVRYCNERGLPVTSGGKLIVAVDESEISRLDELERRARANGVPGITRVDTAGIVEIEPHAAGLSGLHVPGTRVTDFGLVARAFADDVREAGGQLLFGFEVESLRHAEGVVVVDAASGASIRGREVVVCAGAQSDRLSRSSRRLRVVPFRGSYYDLQEGASELVRSMIYPVPDPRFPFLGVHFTRHVDGSVSCGPNAVLALSREHYRRWAFDTRDALSTLTFPGFWRLARRYWREGLAEMKRDASLSLFTEQARRYLPELREEHLSPGGVGVRAQAVDRSGALLDDFVFSWSDRVTYLQNAPSPAATASIAIGTHVVDEMDRRKMF